MQLASSTVSTKQGLSKKVIIGFAAIASAAVMGAVGMVGAATSNQNMNEARKAFCAQYGHHGFKNHGQCVSDWNKKHQGGHGYPKPNKPDKKYGHDVHTEANVEVNGNNNNVVINIWNYFFSD